MSKLNKFGKIQDMIYLLKEYGFEMDESVIDEIWKILDEQSEKIEIHVKESLIR